MPLMTRVLVSGHEPLKSTSKMRIYLLFRLPKSSFGEHELCKMIQTIVATSYSLHRKPFVNHLANFMLPNEDLGKRLGYKPSQSTSKVTPDPCCSVFPNRRLGTMGSMNLFQKSIQQFCMLTKRRFWKSERTFWNAFSKYFSKGLVLDLDHFTLKLLRNAFQKFQNVR
jgi:hypothetical protein